MRANAILEATKMVHVSELDYDDEFEHPVYGPVTLESEPEKFRSPVDGPGYVVNVIDNKGRSQIFIPEKDAMVKLLKKGQS